MLTITIIVSAMSNMYCLQNTRGVNVSDKCRESDIRITKKDHDNGLRITASSLNFKGREKMRIRLTNTYTFGKTVIVAIWTNVVRMIETSSPVGSMKMYPHLSEIWLSSNGKQINGLLPSDMIAKMIREINQIINEKHVSIDSIDLDQFEMLRENNLYSRPDVIFEKLLIYADTMAIASAETILFSREIPDNIELIVAVEDVIGTQPIENSAGFVYEDF